MKDEKSNNVGVITTHETSQWSCFCHSFFQPKTKFRCRGERDPALPGLCQHQRLCAGRKGFFRRSHRVEGPGRNRRREALQSRKFFTCSLILLRALVIHTVKNTALQRACCADVKVSQADQVTVRRLWKRKNCLQWQR